MDYSTSCNAVTAENLNVGAHMDQGLLGKLVGPGSVQGATLGASMPILGALSTSQSPVFDALYKQCSACAIAEFQIMKPEALPLNVHGVTAEANASIKRDVFNNLCAVVLVELYNLCYKNLSLAGYMIIVKDIVKISQMTNISLLELVTVLEYLSITVDKALLSKGLAGIVGSVNECNRAVIAQLNSTLANGDPSITQSLYGAEPKSAALGVNAYGLNALGYTHGGEQLMSSAIGTTRLCESAAPGQHPSTAAYPQIAQVNPGSFKLAIGGSFDVPGMVNTSTMPRQYIAERVTKRNMAYLFGNLSSKPFPLFKKRKVGASVHVGLSKIPNGVRLINMHIFHRTIPKGSFKRQIKCYEDYNEAINFKHGAIFTLVFESCPGTSQA